MFIPINGAEATAGLRVFLSFAENIWRAARPQWNPKRPFSEQNTFPKNGRITLEADIAAALLRLAKI